MHHLAFSDLAGELVLHVPVGQSAIASLIPRPNSSPVSVTCTTVDLFLPAAAATDPDVVIIDTEGNDARVIHGMAELIRRKRPLILFENIFLSEATIQTTLPAGYRHFTVDDLSGELIGTLDKVRGHNSVFIPSPQF